MSTSGKRTSVPVPVLEIGVWPGLSSVKHHLDLFSGVLSTILAGHLAGHFDRCSWFLATGGHSGQTPDDPAPINILCFLP
jgi:hypothetical protein